MRKATYLMLGIALLGAALPVAAQEKKTVLRPGYLGIRFEEQAFFLPSAPERNRSSVTVKDISKDSPAEKAGLRAGDEILRINGMSVGNGKFAAVARTLTEGDTVRLRVKRDDAERDYTLIAAPRPAGYGMLAGDRTIVFSADSVRGLMKMWLDSARLHLDSLKLPRVLIAPGDSAFDIRIERFRGMPGDTLSFGRDSAFLHGLHGRVRLAPEGELFRHFDGELGPGVVFRSIALGSRSIAGAEFTELDPALKSYFGTDRGLLTLRVAEDTPAARAGLLPGDVVQKANGEAVTSVARLRSLFTEKSGTLKLDVVRHGESRQIEIETRGNQWGK